MQQKQKGSKDMNKLITDKDTNMVFFSKYLNRSTRESICNTLNHFKIKWAILPYTKDFWARDYMPIQVSKNQLIKYTYNPDYLQEYSKYITDSTNCCKELHQTILPTNIILDGGNVIKCTNSVIMTDKIFKENPHKKHAQLINELETLFQAELVLIPRDKDEKYGHADGMVRYIDNNRVLINNYWNFDKTLRTKLLHALSNKFEVVELHYDVKKSSNYSWAYINFLLVDNVMFVPCLGKEEDSQALEQLKGLYCVNQAQVNARNLVAQGGALNCISWNVKANDGLLKYYTACQQLNNANTDSIHFES